MAQAPYTNQRDYIKFNKKSCTDTCTECNSGCDECECEEKCSCCPAGLVAIYDDNGNHTGCVTPNDAAGYMQDTYACKDNLIKVVDPVTGAFIGCLSADDFATWYNTLNP